MSASKRLINVKAVGLAIAVFTCTGAFAQPQNEAPSTTSELSPATTAAPTTIYANHTPHPFGGRLAVIISNSENLVPNDTNRVRDVFLQDKQANTFRRLSVDRGGNQISFPSFEQKPAITPDERFIVFKGHNAIINNNTNTQSLLWKDLQTGTIKQVNQPTQDGRMIHFLASRGFRLSNNGNFVVFASSDYIFVRNIHRSVTSRIAPGRDPSININGHLVTFTSGSGNLVVNDTNNSFDIFLHDTQTRATRRLSVNADGTEGNRGSYKSAISPDGRFVAFVSYASNLVPNDTNNAPDIFMSDLLNGTIISITSDLNANVAPGHRITPFRSIYQHLSFSPDSRFLLFNAGIRIPRPRIVHDYVLAFDITSSQILRGPRIVRHP